MTENNNLVEDKEVGCGTGDSVKSREFKRDRWPDGGEMCTCGDVMICDIDLILWMLIDLCIFDLVHV